MPDKRNHKERSIEKIRNGNILDRLIKHVNGELELSATQCTTGIALLKKHLPDTKAVEMNIGGGIEVINKIERHIVNPKHKDS